MDFDMFGLARLDHDNVTLLMVLAHSYYGDVTVMKRIIQFVV